MYKRSEQTVTKTTTVVQQPMNDASDNVQGSRNKLISTLQVIGKVPSDSPDLENASAVLVKLIEQIEAESSCNEGLETLNEKLSQFQSLVNKFAAKNDIETFQSNLDFAEECLSDLIRSIQNANNKGKDIQMFFAKDTKGDSIYTHINGFDKLVADLKGALHAEDGQDVKNPSKQSNKVPKKSKGGRRAQAGASVFELCGNVAENSKGVVLSHLVLEREEIRINENIARGTEGDYLSHMRVKPLPQPESGSDDESSE